MKFELPLQVANRLNGRHHWAALSRATRAERTAACLMTRSMLDNAATAKIERLGATVTLTRIGKRAMDGDNLAASLKGVRDGVADALGMRDHDKRLCWEYGQRTEGRYAVEVEVVINED